MLFFFFFYAREWYCRVLLNDTKMNFERAMRLVLTKKNGRINHIPRPHPDSS